MPLGREWWAIEGQDIPREQRDVKLAKRIGEVLESHYPGHPWFVKVDSRPNVGCAFISLPLLMGNFPFVLHLWRLAGDPTMRAVVRAGGEILERYRMPRTRIDHALWAQALKAHPIEPRTKRTPELAA